MYKEYLSVDDYYMNSCGNRCPRKSCMSRNVLTTDMSDETMTIFRDLICNDCKLEWREVYGMEDYRIKENT